MNKILEKDKLGRWFGGFRKTGRVLLEGVPIRYNSWTGSRSVIHEDRYSAPQVFT